MNEEQKEVEDQLKEEGWDIIHPTLTRDTSKCYHDWVKLKRGEYECSKCLKGHIGEINI